MGRTRTVYNTPMVLYILYYNIIQLLRVRISKHRTNICDVNVNCSYKHGSYIILFAEILILL